MTMSRKDYRVIAAAIREERDTWCPAESLRIDLLAKKIADALAANSGYDANGNRRSDLERVAEDAGVSR